MSVVLDRTGADDPQPTVTINRLKIAARANEGDGREKMTEEVRLCGPPIHSASIFRETLFSALLIHNYVALILVFIANTSPLALPLTSLF